MTRVRRRRVRKPSLDLDFDTAELRAVHDALELLIAEYSSNPSRHHAAAAVRRALTKVERQLERDAEKLSKPKGGSDGTSDR